MASIFYFKKLSFAAFAGQAPEAHALHSSFTSTLQDCNRRSLPWSMTIVNDLTDILLHQSVYKHFIKKSVYSSAAHLFT